MKKETGIIMSDDHPRLILDNVKSQTRRTYGLEKINQNPGLWQSTPTLDPRRWAFYQGPAEAPTELIRVRCPYGGVGDLLWVRETFKYMNREKTQVGYAASPEETCKIGGLILLGNWRPSIFMPRKYSRIERIITGLRPERLQGITEDDARAEGCDWGGWTDDGSWHTPESNFEWLWDSINAKRGYPWAGNWWIWVISF